jgi:hypothetical protein
MADALSGMVNIALLLIRQTGLVNGHLADLIPDWLPEHEIIARQNEVRKTIVNHLDAFYTV